MGLFNRKSAAAPAATIDTPTPDLAPTSDVSGDYALDVTHTRIGFSARHAMVTTVRGSFGDFDGSAHLDSADPAASSVQLTIQVKSVVTGQAQRDEHLRTADFFEADRFPTITFRSTAVEQVDDDTFDVTGDLRARSPCRSR